MERTTAKISKQEVNELLDNGYKLLNILEQNYAWNSKEYARNRSRFISGYTKWYKRSKEIICSLSPDRCKRFQGLFSTNKRSGINEYTYTIQDYIHGVYLEKQARNYVDEVTSKRLKEQMEMLRTASSRLNEFSFDLESFVKINPIYSNRASFTTENTNQIIDIDLEDEHYNSLKTEINSSFRTGLFISTFLLSRTLIENLLIDVLRHIYPPITDENISIYYNIEDQNFRDLNILTSTVTERKSQIPFDDHVLDEILLTLERMSLENIPTSHSDIKIPDREEIISYRIGDTVENLILMKDALKQEQSL